MPYFEGHQRRVSRENTCIGTHNSSHGVRLYLAELDAPIEERDHRRFPVGLLERHCRVVWHPILVVALDGKVYVKTADF